MRAELLELTPTHYLCPYCGEWHEYNREQNLKFYDNYMGRDVFRKECSSQPNGCNHGRYEIYFENGYCYYTTRSLCDVARFNLEGQFPIDKIKESLVQPNVVFYVPFEPWCEIGSNKCHGCSSMDTCVIVRLADEASNGAGSYRGEILVPLGFRFDEDDYAKVTGIDVRANRERKERQGSKPTQQAEKTIAKENKEGLSMKATKLLSQLYEHSPKENVEIAKQWAEKYKPTLRWAVPVAAIYAAYRILNSQKSELTVDNVCEVCEKKLGFKLDELCNQKNLKQLMVLGGLSAGAYAAIKAVSSIYKKDETEIDVEQLEEGMEKLDKKRKQFGWIQPKTEAMLPIAVSVIIVYMMTQKSAWFEVLKKKAKAVTGDFSIRASTYLEMAKLFMADKLHINLDDEEEMKKAKKFALLAGIVGICAILYGKKVLTSKKDGEAEVSENEKKMNSFISQIISVMKQMMPTAFAGLTTFMVTKKLMGFGEDAEDTEAIYGFGSGSEDEKQQNDYAPEDATSKNPEQEGAE